MKIMTHWLPALCLAFLTGCGLDGPIPRGAKHDEPAAAQAPAANTASQPAADKKATRKCCRRTSLFPAETHGRKARHDS